MAELTLERVAEVVGGELVRGSGSRTVHRVMPVEAAGSDALTFVSKAKFLPHLVTCEAAAVLMSADAYQRDGLELASQLAVIIVPHPYVAFARAAQALADRVPRPEGVHPSAAIDERAKVHPTAALGPFVYVGPGASVGEGAVLYPGVHVEANAVVGPGSVLYNHVVIRHGCRVGARCIFHPGVVIGGDGFGFAQARTSEPAGVDHVKIPQVGDVVVEDDVEIGANSCVDRGTLGTTRIGAGTKIDNLVQVAHNVQVGPRGILVAQSGIAGSSTLGRAVTLGAQSGISGHIKIGDGVTVYGQSGVMEDIEPGETICGTPSVSAKDFFRNHVRIKKLVDLAARVKRLERKLEELLVP